MGFSCGEGPGPAAPGDVRAFDVLTGQQRWRFHTVPRPGEYGNATSENDSWQNRGGANAWGGLTVDEKSGTVFAGLGSAAFDFYGGDRKGKNLFANCTIALDARTGQRRWHFQTLHHDLWDHDLPVYPNLVTVTRSGRKIDAVAQVTKTGHVFVFDRNTGTPLFDVRETPVPASDVPGEVAWPTQPIPVKPPPFSRQTMTEAGITFGHGSNFPPQYQRALFISDWTYGRLHAVHLTASGASYTGRLEEFITGTPLPLTDIVINPVDRAMYFSIGGRQTQSGLYRVTWSGSPADSQPSESSIDTGKLARRQRRALD